MSAPMLLSEVREIEISERIEEVVASRDLGVIDELPDAVIAECARRYLASRMKNRERTASRSREQFVKVREEANAKLAIRVRNVVEAAVPDILPNWAVELLRAEFALPDGTRVTWANATVDQHEARAQQLEALASGDLSAAAIHRSAIRDIRNAHVKTLGEALA